MGGGHVSGVAGGPKGSEQQQSTQSSGQKNWPDNGIEAAGQKADMNMVSGEPRWFGRFANEGYILE